MTLNKKTINQEEKQTNKRDLYKGFKSLNEELGVESMDN